MWNVESYMYIFCLYADIMTQSNEKRTAPLIYGQNTFPEVRCCFSVGRIFSVLGCNAIPQLKK